jgi:large subunit ribosomal protein L2
MGTRNYKAITNGLRGRSVLDFADLTTNKAEKSLLGKIKKKAGRNNLGRITVRRRGGGARRRYRFVDVKRDKENIEGTVKTIEYDPNRSANVSLIFYKDGEKRYIITPNTVKVGDIIEAGVSADIRVGNTLPLRNIPVGSQIHNVELSILRGGQVARSAGTYCVLMAKSEKYATIKMPSGEIRLINIKCKATVGQVGNQEKRNTVVGKAGASRWLGKRPSVRGAVMNPCDHPHGGGEGKAPVGRSGPMTPWGKPALGHKTRKLKRTQKFILRRRK